MVSGRFAPMLIRPIARVRPDKVDSPDVHLSFLKPDKRNMHGKIVTAHVESTVN